MNKLRSSVPVGCWNSTGASEFSVWLISVVEKRSLLKKARKLLHCDPLVLNNNVNKFVQYGMLLPGKPGWKDQTVSTRGGKQQGLGPRNDVLTTCKAIR